MVDTQDYEFWNFDADLIAQNCIDGDFMGEGWPDLVQDTLFVDL
jgi:hypothetical protein